MPDKAERKSSNIPVVSSAVPATPSGPREPIKSLAFPSASKKEIPKSSIAVRASDVFVASLVELISKMYLQ